MMAAGFGLLRLSPAVFWSLTPRELAAALRAFTGPLTGPHLDRRGLDRLMARFPDRED
ncbi:MAG: phage tail assembly chaperone [Hyphomicrobiaceae bacterium]